MKNKIFIKIVILLLVLLVGITSSTPMVLCFGEDGHIRIENLTISITDPFFAPIFGNMNCFYLAYEDNSNNSDCGDCFDLQIFSDKFIVKTFIDTDEFFSTPLPIVSPRTLLKSVQEELLEAMGCIFGSHPDFMLNCIHEKVILLI
jgi:hypothetical protein